MEFPHHCYHGNRPMHVVQMLHVLPHDHQLAVLQGVWPHQLHRLIQEKQTYLRGSMAGRVICRPSLTAPLKLSTHCVVGGVSIMLRSPSVPCKPVALETVPPCGITGDG